MAAYIVRRTLLMIPTLLGIMVLNFVIVQAAPGGPVEQIIAQLQGKSVSATAPFGGRTGERAGGRPRSAPELIKRPEPQFGFDKPAHERFVSMMSRYLRFDFGESFFRSRSVLRLVIDRLPVSISLGLWTTLLTYLICIPLGVAKAVRDGSRFDVWTSAVVIVGNAIPSFLFAILLIVVF